MFVEAEMIKNQKEKIDHSVCDQLLDLIVRSTCHQVL